MQKIMILSVLIMIPNWAVAGNSNPTHTHTNTPIELGFVSANSSGIRVAAVCFLGMGDCGSGGFEDMTLDTGNKCRQEGYDKTICALPSYLSNACPYDANYYAQCEIDTKRACEDSGFVSACGLGEVAETSCPYDASYKKCKCNPCAGYDYISAQAMAQGYVSDGICQSCDLVKYKRKENPCSGYTTCECGGEIGAKVCYSGSVKKYNNCHSCCENKCTLASCPANHSCDYEACSNKYCDLGCAGGFTDMCLVNDGCVAWGYRQQSCVGDILYCPYDTTYRFCLSL